MPCILVTDQSTKAGAGSDAVRRRRRKAAGPWPLIAAIVLGGFTAVPIVLIGVWVIDRVLQGS